MAKLDNFPHSTKTVCEQGAPEKDARARRPEEDGTRLKAFLGPTPAGKKRARLVRWQA